MTWVSVLKLLLQLASFIARRAEKYEIERSLINELDVLQGKRVKDAEAARDDVRSGRMPIDPNDPYRRD